jgi:Family of unknown function (DUF6476)
MDKTDTASASPLMSPDQERWLRRAVIVMGVLLVVGIATVIGRVIYLSTTGTSQGAGAGNLAARAALALPAGAEIRSISLSGSRLAVHYGVGTQPAIAVLDLTSGQTVSRVDIVPEAPRR